MYALDFGLDLAAAYSDQDQENQTTLGAAYTFQDLYLAATYAMGSVANNDDFTSLEVAAQYKFTKEFRLIGNLINDVLDGLVANPDDNSAVEAAVKAQVETLCKRFPLYK